MDANPPFIQLLRSLLNSLMRVWGTPAMRRFVGPKAHRLRLGTLPVLSARDAVRPAPRPWCGLLELAGQTEEGRVVREGSHEVRAHWQAFG